MGKALSVDLGAPGRTTSARLYEPTGDDPCTLVLAHGAGADQGHPWMVGISEGLASRGVRVVTFNFPYTEAKRRSPDPPSVLEECFRAVLGRVREAEVPLFVGGKSMGGRMASRVVAEGEPHVRGLVCFGYPLHPPGKPDQLRTEHFPRIRLPVLIIQGSRDSFGTPDELRPHLARIPAPVTLHVMEGGDHSFKAPKKLVPDPEGAKAQLLDVVADWLRHFSRNNPNALV